VALGDSSSLPAGS